MTSAHPPLSAAQQLYHLRRSGIAVGAGDVRRGELVWRMVVQPTSASRLYQLRLRLHEGDAPELVVEGPDLPALAGGRKLPHVYGEAPVELCLYHPDYGEWQPWMRLDRTIVPWAYLWLYYFEDWLFTDEWAGGGEHPQGGTRRTRRLVARAHRPPPFRGRRP